MKNFLMRITQHTSSSHELGHSFIRISIGIIFLIFGYGKLTSGAENLTGIGSAMAVFGITNGYLYWGYMDIGKDLHRLILHKGVFDMSNQKFSVFYLFYL